MKQDKVNQCKYHGIDLLHFIPVLIVHCTQPTDEEFTLNTCATPCKPTIHPHC